ncbi:MAG: succinyl-diaminopimelate desuccinylase [Acidimicrobiia bacterium]
MNPLHQTLAELVDIPSVTGNEGRLCTAIAERLMPTWTLEGVTRVGNSLVVGRPNGRPMIVLYGHIDTVPVQGNAAARIEGDRMYGLGTTDMKAGVAVMIHLLENQEIIDGPYDVVGVFYDKEEGPSADNGLEEVLDRVPWLTGSQLAVVLEPTDLRLELGCNGMINADVVFTGRAAHSARPWMGENAVTKAGAWLDRLHRMQPESVYVEGLEYREVFSVTRAGGGIANNIIPSEFVVNLNYRFPPVYQLDEAERRLRLIAADADAVTVRDRAAAGAVPVGNEHIERLSVVLGASRAGKQGWTDVARLSGRGVAAVNYGPGDPSLAHRPDESVVLANLDIAYDGLGRFLTRR